MSKEVTVIQSGKRESFTPEVKKRIVADSYESGKSLNRFSKCMGISPATLSNWRREFKGQGIKETDCTAIIPKDFQSPLQKENEALKQRNAMLSDYVSKIEAFIGRKTFELELKNTQSYN